MPRRARGSLQKIDEHKELVSQEAGAASGAAASAVSEEEKEYWRREAQCVVILEKRSTVCNMEMHTVSGFEKVRKAVERCEVPTELREQMLEMVEEIEINVPAVFAWDAKSTTLLEWFELLLKAIPNCNNKTLVNLVGVLKGSIFSTSTSDKSSSMSGFLSFSERGRHALQSRIEFDLPTPVDDGLAEQIWPLDCWITNEGPGNSMVKMLKLLSEQESMKTSCTFELQDKSKVESVCGKDSKLDLLLVLKGTYADVYTTGAIISVHSKGAASKVDNPDSIGRAIHYGLKFLRNAGAARKYICVGITDLKEIIWFKVSADFERINEYCTRVPATGRVRQSLCGFLLAKPASLGLALNHGLRELFLPPNWQWKRTLGHGRTSIVHEIDIEGTSYAVKIPNPEMHLAKDYLYLSKLKGVDGIPSVYTQVGKMLVLKPVGQPFSLSCLEQFQLMQSLPQLVDILKAAHDRGYVNRDIRVENFMVARSLQEPRERLFILDWGYAAECGTECQFAGCLYTSSNNVLSQLVDNSCKVTYSGADDLVAVIRCMCMFFYSKVANAVLCNFKLSKGKEQVESLMACWKAYVSANAVWGEAERKAQNADYDGVKDFLRILGGIMYGSCVDGMVAG